MLVARVAKSSVGYTGGTWDIFTNCHLFVLHGNICDISSFSMLDQIPGESDLQVLRHSDEAVEGERAEEEDGMVNWWKHL